MELSFEAWEAAVVAMRARLGPIGGAIVGSAVIGLLRGEVFGRDVDLDLGPAGAAYFRQWYPGAPLRGYYEADGVLWHLHAGWARPDYPGIDVLALRSTASGLEARRSDQPIDLAEALAHVSARTYRLLDPITPAALLRARRLDALGWHATDRSALGDHVERMLAPAVNLLDRHLRTQLSGCPSCARRRASLNHLARTLQHPFNSSA